jgi:hypothetical protein
MKPVNKLQILFLSITLLSFAMACNSSSRPEETLNDTSTTRTSETKQVDSSVVISDDTSTAGTTLSLEARTAEYLRAYMKEDLDKQLIDSASRKFSVEEIDLNRDNQPEVIVAMQGSYFCGSGGCTLLIFDPTGKLLSRFSVVRTPIGIDDNATKGWRNLLLPSRGRLHLVKFDGTKYPSNPSVQPVIDFSETKGVVSIFVTDDPEKVFTF